MTKIQFLYRNIKRDHSIFQRCFKIPVQISNGKNKEFIENNTEEEIKILKIRLKENWILIQFGFQMTNYIDKF